MTLYHQSKIPNSLPLGLPFVLVRERFSRVRIIAMISTIAFDCTEVMEILPMPHAILKKKHTLSTSLHPNFPMATAKLDKKCIVCKIDLNLQKSFKEREDWETVKFCSSKCRKSTASRSKRR